MPIDAFRNRIILAGMTAPGLFDEHASPDARAYTAVELGANQIAGILDCTRKRRPPYLSRAEVALLLLIGLAMTVLLPLLSPLRATLFTALVPTVLVILILTVWSDSNLVLPLASSVLMVALLDKLKLWEQFVAF